MNKVLLTIAVPTFNGGKALIEAIKSCDYINLQRDAFEVLIVDNCSTDDSIHEIEILQSESSTIRIVKNESNIGRIQNWNKCLELASGEFILFLFANDLIAKENYIPESLKMLQDNDQCALVSAPWIFSDYNMTNMYVQPQFYKRTPGYGYYEAEPHIKSVVESGKFPFVCLQSTFLRRSFIKNAALAFDPTLPLTCDGVFLAELAVQTNCVAFIDKTTMIFRHDAPNRQHSNVKLHEHIKQMFVAFLKISLLCKKSKINLNLAFSNYKGLESFLDYFFRSRTIEEFRYSKQIIASWWQSVRIKQINIILLLTLLSLRIGLLPLKSFSYFKNLKTAK